MNKKSSRLKRWVLIFLAFLLLALVGLFWFGARQVLNLGRAAAPPPQTTLLPTFSPTMTIANPTATPEPPEAALQERAAGLPDPDGYVWEAAASGFERPVGLADAGDGSGRLFVAEQAGVIRILVDGEIVPVPFLDIRDRVGSSGNEQGLLGLAFDPNYVQNGYFYVNYTDLRGDTVIARYRVSADPNAADPGTESRLLEVRQPYANHNGGHLAFGPDGGLYAGLGDGGLAGDPEGNGQNPGVFLGKLLRFDLEGGTVEIWASGLRNPWRFNFDPLTGDLFIGDVGQNAWEEINFLPAGTPAGANFGWDYYEGTHAYEGQPPEGSDFVFPVAEYGRGTGNCSVTGGVVYRGQRLDEWQAVYLYGDFCSGRVWGLVQNPDGSWQNELLFDLDANISSFGIDQDGEVYILDLGGRILRLVEK